MFDFAAFTDGARGFGFVEEIFQSWCAEVAMQLRDVRDPDGWSVSIQHLRSSLEQHVSNNEIGMRTSGHALYVLDILQTSCEYDKHFFVLGSVLQVESFKISGNPFVTQLGDALYRRGGADALRMTYDMVRSRARERQRRVQQESADYASWLWDLGQLATSLFELHLTPVTTGLQGVNTDWHPLARALFSHGELEQLRRDEAYFAEQFAHMFACIVGKSYLRESFPSAPERVGELSHTDRRALREQLRSRRARYTLPPFLFKDLDRILSE
jgi:hypothetical protein